jgi:hypothetical protein
MNECRKIVLCAGDVCAGCGLCERCGKTTRPIHLNYCACPEGQAHWLCSGCKAKSIAWTLAPYDSKPWWNADA